MADTPEAAQPSSPGGFSAYTKDGQASFISPGGDPVWVPAAEAVSYQQAGYTPEDESAYNARLSLEKDAAEYDNVGAAMLAGVLRGGTAGLSDLAANQMGYGGDLAKYREHNPISSAVSEGVGTLASFLGGPLGLVERAAVGAAGRLGAGALSKAVAAGAATGAAMGASEGVSSVSLKEKPAEPDYDSFKEVLSDAATGGLSGVALGFLGAGLTQLAKRARGSVSGLTKAGRGVRAEYKAIQKDFSAQEARLAELQKLRQGKLTGVSAKNADDRILSLERELLDNQHLGLSIDGVRAARQARDASLRSGQIDAIASGAENLVRSEAGRALAQQVANAGIYAAGGALLGHAPTGALVGALQSGAWLTPVVQKIQAFAAPMASSAVKAGLRASGPVARTTGRVVRATAAKPKSLTTMSPKELSDLRAELLNAPPVEEVEPVLAERLSSVAPPEIANRVTHNTSRGLEHIIEAIFGNDRESSSIPTGRANFNPSKAERREMTRKIDTVVNPQDFVSRALGGTATQSEFRVFRSVYPDEAQAIARVIEENLGKARALGRYYSHRRAAELRRVMDGIAPTGENQAGSPSLVPQPIPPTAPPPRPINTGLADRAATGLQDNPLIHGGGY